MKWKKSLNILMILAIMFPLLQGVPEGINVFANTETNLTNSSKNTVTDVTGTKLPDDSLSFSTSIQNNGEEETGDTQLKVGEDFALKYKFAIDNTYSKSIKAGDYYTFSLPPFIKLDLTKVLTGDLANDQGIVFGSYEIKDGQVKITFNDQVAKYSNLTGSITVSGQVAELAEADGNQKVYPFFEQKITITDQKKTDSKIKIKKTGKVLKNGVMAWTLKIDCPKNSEIDLNKLIINDVMNNQQVLTDAKGVPSQSAFEVLDSDITVELTKNSSGNYNFSLKNEAMKLKDSVTIIYYSKDQGTSSKPNNNSAFVYYEDNKTGEAKDVTANDFKLIKTGEIKGSDDKKYLLWTVVVDPQGHPYGPNAKVIDDINEGMGYITDSFEVVEPTGSKNLKCEVTTTENGHQRLIITGFKPGDTTKYTFTLKANYREKDSQGNNYAQYRNEVNYYDNYRTAWSGFSVLPFGDNNKENVTKKGKMVDSKNGIAHYDVTLHLPIYADAFKGDIIVDDLPGTNEDNQPFFNFDKKSLKIFAGDQDVTKTILKKESKIGEQQLKLVLDADGITHNIKLSYDVKLNPNLNYEAKVQNILSVKGEYVKADQVNHDIVFKGEDSHGEMDGIQYKLKLNKVDANNNQVKLAGAQFGLYRYGISDDNYVRDFVDNDDGTYDVTGLTAGTYYIKETKAPAGYQKLTKPVKIELGDGQTPNDNTYVKTIENTKKPTSVTGKKIWIDKDISARPERILVQLKQRIKDETKWSSIETKEVTAANNWQYSFDNLPTSVKDSAGHFKEVEYKVVEKDVPAGYQSTLVPAIDSNGHDWRMNLINVKKNMDVISRTVTKKWNDDHNKLKLRPQFVQFMLYQDGVAYRNGFAFAKNDWKVTFGLLPKKDEAGHLYDYTIKEINQDEDYQLTDVTDNTFTNTLLTDITINKRWDDQNNVENRPNTVFADIFQDDQVVRTVVLTKENGWVAHVNDLPKFDETGHEYDYRVVEKQIEGYLPTYDAIKISKDFYAIITNHSVLNGKTSVSVTKKWLDVNKSTRPTAVKVQLEQRKRSEGKWQAVPNSKQVLSSENNWHYTFENLPRFVKDGQNESIELEYRIAEVNKPKNYESSLIPALDSNGQDNKYILLNVQKNLDTTQLKVEKIWHDQGQTADRPDQLKFKLYQIYTNEAGKKERKIYRVGFASEASNWQVNFQKLPETSATGEKYMYEAVEDFASANYTLTSAKTVERNGLFTTIFTNTHVPNTPPDSPYIPEIPPLTPPLTPDNPEEVQPNINNPHENKKPTIKGVQTTKPQNHAQKLPQTNEAKSFWLTVIGAISLVSAILISVIVIRLSRTKKFK